MTKDNKQTVEMKSAIESILSQGVDEIEKNVNKLYEETRNSIEYVNTGFEKSVNDYIKKLDVLEEEIAEYEDELNDIYEETSNPEQAKELIKGLIESVMNFEHNAKEIEKIEVEQSQYEEGSEKWIELEKQRQELLIKNEEIKSQINELKDKLNAIGVTDDMYNEILEIGKAQYILSKEAKGYEDLIENANKMKDDSIKAVSENPIVINILRYMARLLKANITFVGGSETVIGTVDEAEHEIVVPIAQPAQPE